MGLASPCRSPYLTSFRSPQLSPKKTWEGFVGGFFSTVVFGILVKASERIVVGCHVPAMAPSSNFPGVPSSCPTSWQAIATLCARWSSTATQTASPWTVSPPNSSSCRSTRCPPSCSLSLAGYMCHAPPSHAFRLCLRLALSLEFCVLQRPVEDYTPSGFQRHLSLSLSLIPDHRPHVPLPDPQHRPFCLCLHRGPVWGLFCQWFQASL